MYLTRMTISGFRGLSTTIEFSEPMSMLIGPNNAGKSSTIDALRTVLQPHMGQHGRHWLTQNDFTRATDEAEPATELQISVEFAGITKAEQGRMISLLAPSLGQGCARLTLRAELAADGRVVSRYYGGDLEHSEVEGLARDSVRFVYLPPLRDASADLRPGSSNRLPSLVSSQTPAGHADRDKLVAIMSQANVDLAAVEAIVKASSAIQDRLSGITGSGPYSHRAELKFADAKYEKIIRALQALGGGSTASELTENGLGYNNLIYMSVLLAALESDETPLSVLLIEEPEAHLHPQLQTRLMEYFETLTVGHAQVIATSHSAQFASSSRIDRITALFRDTPHGGEAHRLSMAKLDPKESRHLERFLDVTKSALLFAQGVILVEGAGEQLVMTSLATRLGASLSEFGVTVVNVEGLAFAPFVKLFMPNALNVRCALVTDADPRTNESGEYIPLSATARKLRKSHGGNIYVALSSRTFEWDMAQANWENPQLLIAALKDVKPRLGRKLEETSFGTASDFADAFLAAVGKKKGEFGLALASQLDAAVDSPFVVPDYLGEAIAWVATDQRAGSSMSNKAAGS